MRTLNAIRALGPIDFQGIRRDAFLRWMLLFPLVLAVAIRFAVPPLAERILDGAGLDIRPFYPLVMGGVLLMIPALAGIVIGFLLLDQRDDGTLVALRVTPLSTVNYVVYRIALPVLLSILTTLVAFPVAGLVALGAVELLVCALAAAPLAPMFALFLAAFAENKVQGFALMKAASAVQVPPAIAFFVPLPWQLAFGLVPTYWGQKLVWMFSAGEAGSAGYFVVGMLYQAAIVGLLMRRFIKHSTA
jgi:fluoroquinolone transport system permease protein